MDFSILRNLRDNKDWQGVINICSKIHPPDILDRMMLYRFLDEYYIALYRTEQFEKCIEILQYCSLCHVDDHSVRNTDYLLPYLKKRGLPEDLPPRKVVATYDVHRKPKEDEIIIIYGDFPSLFENLIIHNPVRRHLKYFWQIEHDLVEASTIYDAIDRIYIINLDERVDRYIETLRECKRMDIPLSIVQRFSASKCNFKANPELRGHIGCMQSHIAVFHDADKNGYDNIIVLEDDYNFTDDLDKHASDLETFLERKYDFDVVLLSTSRYYRCEPYDDILSLSFQECTTTAGYLVGASGRKRILPIWKDGLEKLVKTEDARTYAVDRCWSVLQKDKKFFVFKNKFGFQRAGYSSITGKTTFSMD